MIYRIGINFATIHSTKYNIHFMKFLSYTLQAKNTDKHAVFTVSDFRKIKKIRMMMRQGTSN